MGRVVVGVDGSKPGQKALAFAVDEARMRSAALEIVHVRAGSRQGARPTQGIESEYASAEAFRAAVELEQEQRDEAERHARQGAENLLNQVVNEVDVDGVDVEKTILVDRRPARRLVELVNSRDDVEMLVVGSRGLGELSGLLLGSVSQACVTHARVPVTVVHQRLR